MEEKRQAEISRRTAFLYDRYGYICDTDGQLGDTEFTFHFQTSSRPVNRGMCYMNPKTEQFYLKSRAEHVPVNILPAKDISKSIPRELIVLEMEQPKKLGKYKFVDFFVTG